MRNKINHWLYSKASLTFFICLLSVSFLTAQNVSGELIDADGEPLFGAHVIVQGTDRATITDIEGLYTIQASQGDVLLVRYVGYQDQVITVGATNNISFIMVPDSALSDEPIVIGYGTRRKSHVTDAIVQLDGSDIASIQSARVDDALAGKLSGVLIQNKDGAIGADPRIQIRGLSFINSETKPLIVVDGYQISGNLATVNPNDIQTLTVLKDAASTAIYGSRGTDGVILITTKKGKPGKPSFSYNGYVSTSSRYVNNNINQTSGEWANTIESNVANGSWDISEVDEALYDYRLEAFKNAPDAIAVEDWLFQNGSTMSHDISVSGGSDAINYFASFGYLNTEGVVRTQGFERYNTRLNLNANIGKRFKTGININGFVSDRDIEGVDQIDLLSAYSIHPIYHTKASIAFVQELNEEAIALGLVPFDSGFIGAPIGADWNNSIATLEPGMAAHDWHYGRFGNGIGGSNDTGPGTRLDNTDKYQKTFFGNAIAFLQYEIADGLNIKTAFGIDRNRTEDYFWRGFSSPLLATFLNETDLETTTNLSTTTLNYNKNFGKHDLAAIIGYEYQKRTIDNSTMQAMRLPLGEPINFESSDHPVIGISRGSITITRKDLFGRINYAYDNRYLASVSVSREANPGSQFADIDKYKIFPAFSLGWNVHKESFWNSELLSDLKVRFSNGGLGTTTTETNFGINLGFLQNRFTLGVDYYNSETLDPTTDFFLSGPNPQVFESSNLVGSSGVEFEVGAVVVQKGDFRWHVNANLSTIQTEILDIDSPTRSISRNGPQFRNFVGGEIGEMWGFETTGAVEMIHVADPTVNIGITSGASYVVDQNGDGVINDDDIVKIGQNTPDFYWGISGQVYYKNYDLSFQFQGAHGGDVYNFDPLIYGSEIDEFRLRDSFDADGDGFADHNGLPYLRHDGRPTDAFIQDASYAALRNITIGYTIKDDWTKTIGLGSLRVYVASTNLLYLTGGSYTSSNPEGVQTNTTDIFGNSINLGPKSYGVQLGASPIVRSFTLGLNVDF